MCIRDRFEAALEDNRLSGLSDEVTAVKEIIAANDDLSKMCIRDRCMGLAVML